jgi:hypothetical protein
MGDHKMKKAELEKLIAERVKVVKARMIAESKKTTKPVAKKKLQKEGIEDVKLPSTVQVYLSKVIDTIKKVPLNKFQQMSIIYHLIEALGVEVKDLNMFMSIIKHSITGAENNPTA